MDKLLILDKILKNDKLLFSEGVIRIGDDPYFSLDKVRKIVTKIVKDDGPSNFKKLPISMRIGMIVVFEEQIQRKTKPRNEYEFNSIYAVAISQYDINNRNKVRFNSSLQEIHPEDPCTFYEFKGRKKGKYQSALKKITKNDSWLTESSEVRESLQDIYNEVKQCYMK